MALDRYSEIRKKLENSSGSKFWRSLDEFAETREFQEMLHSEFPEYTSEYTDEVSRRNFLKLMGASLALAGLTACTKQPVEKIVPYVRQPEEIIPGKPLFFSSAFCLSGVASGLLVESNMGRPTKIEGNPDHPESLGATDKFAQASLLELYDPDRSQTVEYLGDIRSWSDFLQAVRGTVAADGSGLRILTETITSPSIGAQLQQILKKYPNAKWHQYEPAGRNNVREGMRMAFGKYGECHYRFDLADVVLAIDSDFLNCGAGSLRYVRDFVRKRNPDTNGGKMNRLYVVENCPSNTGATADHRKKMKASDIPAFAYQLHSMLTGGSSDPWMSALAKDLRQNHGKSIVIAGDYQPPEVHAVVHAINEALGNAGTTTLYTDSIEINPVDQIQSLHDLVGEMFAGQVKTLLIVGGNPVYNAPVDLQFEKALSHVPLCAHLSLYEDETSNFCQWHVPQAHYLETWSDARAFDGTVSIIQPLIAPLYNGKSAQEFLAVLADDPQASAHDIVKNYWQKQSAAADFEDFWRKALHDGLIQGTALPTNAGGKASVPPAPKSAVSGIEIVFRPDPTIYDGRFANNGWLQEVPKALSKLTWDNAAYMSVAMAQKMNLQNEDVVWLNCGGRKVKAPVWIMPGHAEDSITLHLGYGRWRAGRVGKGVGTNTYLLRASKNLWTAEVQVNATGEKYRLACTQNHYVMEQRNLIRSSPLEHYLQHPDFAQESEEEKEAEKHSMYPAYKYDGYKWGMSIDLNSCVGCNACVVACISENNIATVGKDQVARGREMHWLRVDRYYEGTPENPDYHFQPVPCMHCENAPCELVCPVNATVHSTEGLNEMVYNRCVGTRYCSNNCPYKVRHFNFYLYSDFTTPSLKLMRNPDVTVRSRGVMEKCSYCVQRINAAKIESEKQNRPVHDGEIQTACQQVCPAEAIVFGNMNDPNSKVAKLKSQQRNYGILTDLNTRPRTTYLANLRNPNPEIKKFTTE